MNYNNTEKDRILIGNLLTIKDSLSKDLDKNINNQTSTLEIIVSELYKLKKDESPIFYEIFNLAALINMSSIDYIITLKNLYFAENDWDRRYYIRQGYLIVFEFFKTYYSNNKSFSILRNLINESSLLNIEKEISIDLRFFKKANEDILEKIRNSTIAHREKNALFQIDLIEKLNYSDSITILLTFYEIILKLGNYNQLLINYSLNNKI